MVNEIPMKKKFQHIITVGVWFGKTNPIMPIYVDKFVEMMNKLNTKRISCVVKGNQLFLKPYVINSVDDTLARKKLNGKLACRAYEGYVWCYLRGSYIKGSVRYLINGKIELRKAESTKKCMVEAAEKGSPVRGIKNVSPLVFLK